MVVEQQQHIATVSEFRKHGWKKKQKGILTSPTAWRNKDSLIKIKLKQQTATHLYLDVNLLDTQIWSNVDNVPHKRDTRMQGWAVE